MPIETAGLAQRELRIVPTTHADQINADLLEFIKS
jgi:hypothetical protein